VVSMERDATLDPGSGRSCEADGGRARFGATAVMGAFALWLVGLCLCGVPAALALTIELRDVAPDRIERQRAAQAGGPPLPGTPDTNRLEARLAERGLAMGAPVFIRVFKAESELEVWMRAGEQFELLAVYPICYWSGSIGPKLLEGDKQNPEGFYAVNRRLLHRSGRWPQSLNLGFPNLLDRAHGRTGSYILVHGGCSSVGCFAMTDPVMQEIFKLTEAALRAGQPAVDVHVFPFRPTEEALARHAASEWISFWRNLKEGYDSFERTRRPPLVSICDRRYHIRDAGPGEVADNGPLTVCGGLPAAPLHLALSLPVETSRSSRRRNLRAPTARLLRERTTRSRQSRRRTTVTLRADPPSSKGAPRSEPATRGPTIGPGGRAVSRAAAKRRFARPAAAPSGATPLPAGSAERNTRARETPCRSTRRPCAGSSQRLEVARRQGDAKVRSTGKSARAARPGAAAVLGRRGTRLAGSR
jgi:murein L,D-transpeptidase YafK